VLVAVEASGAAPAPSDEAIAWAREVWDAMERYSTGRVYLNFPGLGEEKDELARAGYGENYDRLAELKAKYDPENLFRMNINIPPAGCTSPAPVRSPRPPRRARAHSGSRRR